MGVNDSLEGTLIKAVPREKENIGIDTENSIAEKIYDEAINSTLDISAFENFLNVSQNREVIYRIIDTMEQDPKVSSIIEDYAEDATETNSEGHVMWVESEDEKCRQWVEGILDSVNIDKHAFGWMYSLLKYGDLYLHLIRQSDYDSAFLVDRQDEDERISLTESLFKESVILNVPAKNDKFAKFLDKIDNPGEMFELTKYGKSVVYIKAPYEVWTTRNTLGNTATQYDSSFMNQYKMVSNDVDIYMPSEFVHMSLDDNSTRCPEEVELFKGNSIDSSDSVSYKVNRGKSVLYDWYRAWRMLSLMEDSIILNRLTKSSIIRIFQIDVGDMPKNMIASHLQSIKAMVEQKAAVNSNVSMSEYSNPGPIENSIYIPVHEGKGSVNVGSIGGDFDPKSLVDLDYFLTNFYSGTGVPKAIAGWTEDTAGFSGGESLALLSSKYAKRVKRYQQAFISGITTFVNILALDRHLDEYVNNFTLRMTSPVTREEIERKEAQTSSLAILRDTMDILSEVTDPVIRLKIVKSLLQDITSNNEVTQLIQDQIDELEQEKENGGNTDTSTPEESDERVSAMQRPAMSPRIEGSEEEVREFSNPLANTEEESSVEETTTETSSEDVLPSFEELGINGL